MVNIENRRYVVIMSEEVSLLDFSKFLETSADTLIYNPERTLTVVKYLNEERYGFRYPTYGPFNVQELNEWKENNGWPFIDDIDGPEDSTSTDTSI